ncbi:MAG: hemolysin III family protein [Bacilli bacterium]|nr:hemolysin III family protein [Bacilli bacterium]
MFRISIPKYTLAEELINSISHGIGALLSIPALILMIIKADTGKEIFLCTIFGTSMILLYTMSCIYHALARNNGKKVLRVLDHCNVYLLVWGTYIPVTLLAVRGTLGWVLFGIVSLISVVGITFSAINVDKFSVLEVVCHLINGWSIVFGIKSIIANVGTKGLLFMLIGGVLYSLGSRLYGVGSKVKYMHSIFHLFCLFGTLFHFLAIYLYVL